MVPRGWSTRHPRNFLVMCCVTCSTCGLLTPLFGCPHPMTVQSPDNLDNCSQAPQIPLHCQAEQSHSCWHPSSIGGTVQDGRQLLPVLGFVHGFSFGCRHMAFSFSLLIYHFGGLPRKASEREDSPGDRCEPKEAICKKAKITSRNQLLAKSGGSSHDVSPFHQGFLWGLWRTLS